MSILTAILLGFAMGFLSGLGIGGGKVLVPVLVFAYGVDQHAAQGIVLGAFLPMAAIAAYVHYTQGTVRPMMALYILSGSLVGAMGGALLAIEAPHPWLRSGYGFFLLAIGIYEMFNREGTHTDDSHAEGQGGAP